MPGGRSEMAGLRRAVAQIEAEAGERPDERAPMRLPIASAFNSALGGGLAADGLHEIAPAEPQDGPATMGFALGLAARFVSLKAASALVIGEAFAGREAGALYGPGLVAHGLPLSRLVFVEAPDAASAFWAMEEALKCGAPAAVVGEIWSLKAYSLAASRRLLLAARKGRTPALLVLARAHGQAARLSSAAETRFEISAAPSERRKAAAGKDLPGPFACGARLVKARLARAGPEPFRAFDMERVVRLEWRSEERVFSEIAAFDKDLAGDDPTISLPLAAASVDGPRAAARRR
jgi:protein ImuA